MCSEIVPMASLHDLVRTRDVAAVEAAIASGADPNTFDACGFSPLVWAVSNRDVDMVRALLAAGADPNACPEVPSDARSAMWEAGHGGLPAVAELLIGAGGDVNTKTPAGETALMGLVRAGDDALAPARLQVCQKQRQVAVNDSTVLLFCSISFVPRASTHGPVVLGLPEIEPAHRVALCHNGAWGWG